MTDTPVWKAAVAKLVTEFAYGDHVTRSWFCDVFGIEYPKVASIATMRKLDFTLMGMRVKFDETLLRDHKMALRSLGHGEWEIVPPNEQTAHAVSQTASGVLRAFAKGREIIEHTKVDELTPAEQKIRTDALAKLGSLELMMRKRLGPIEVAKGLPPDDGEVGER